MKLSKMTTVAAVLVAYVCSISFAVLGALAQTAGGMPPALGGGVNSSNLNQYLFDPNNVTGTINDANGRPLANQLVEFFDMHGNLIGNATTNANGVFTISLPPSSYINMVSGGISSVITTASSSAAATAGSLSVSGAAASATSVALAGVLPTGLSIPVVAFTATALVGGAVVVTKQNKGS
ncbi:MAG: carboxypeptidase-like regulatory domain-containing protein [Nitrospinota bacterium]|nr:carboxypeptidase-like regulatory domain-containing protein [Nitrospinota bacterium]